MNFEHFEMDVLNLCNKHKLPNMLLIFPNGNDLAIHAFGADDSMDGMVAKAMARVCSKALVAAQDDIAHEVAKEIIARVIDAETP